MSVFIYSIRERAAALQRAIVFPESGDPRILEAAEALRKAGIVRPVLLLDPAMPLSHAAARATGADTILCDDTPLLDFADRLVANGTFDGCVAGSIRTTADVLRAALRNIGVKPGMKTVSSAFYMVASRPWEASS